VLTALGNAPEDTTVRFSFSRFTTKEDIDFAIAALKELIPVTA
jgi:cysteine desulfurase